MDKFNTLCSLVSQAHLLIGQMDLETLFTNQANQIENLTNDNSQLKAQIVNLNKQIGELNFKYDKDMELITNELKSKQEDLASLTKVSYIQSINKQLVEKTNYCNILEMQLDKLKREQSQSLQTQPNPVIEKLAKKAAEAEAEIKAQKEQSEKAKLSVGKKSKKQMVVEENENIEPDVPVITKSEIVEVEPIGEETIEKTEPDVDETKPKKNKKSKKHEEHEEHEEHDETEPVIQADEPVVEPEQIIEEQVVEETKPKKNKKSKKLEEPVIEAELEPFEETKPKSNKKSKKHEEPVAEPEPEPEPNVQVEEPVIEAELEPVEETKPKSNKKSKKQIVEEPVVEAEPEPEPDVQGEEPVVEETKPKSNKKSKKQMVEEDEELLPEPVVEAEETSTKKNKKAKKQVLVEEPVVEESDEFNPENFEDINGFELLQYKSNYYLRDLETSELYDIEFNKPGKIVGLINGKGKVKLH